MEKALKDLAHIVVVAPDQERSAVSHGLTLRTPLNLKEVSADHYVLNGTPADCVIFALRHLFVQLSGSGDFRHQSRRQSGRRHHVFRNGGCGARSGASWHARRWRFRRPMTTSRSASRKGPRLSGIWWQRMLRNGLGGEICLNVNIPVRKIKGMKITRQGCSEHTPHFNALDRKADYDAVPPSPAPGRRPISCPTARRLWSIMFRSRRCSAIRRTMRPLNR